MLTLAPKAMPARPSAARLDSRRHLSYPPSAVDDGGEAERRQARYRPHQKADGAHDLTYAEQRYEPRRQAVAGETLRYRIGAHDFSQPGAAENEE